jgi:N-methylhydantoinase A/oxoprolinase/acetone carboxylase beta subunit
VPSTPADPSQSVHAGTARLDFDLADIAKLVHGTTVANTTIIERKGARTAVLTTAGFRDVLEDLQKAAGHRDPSTTKLYDRRGVQSGKGGVVFCDVLILDRAWRELSQRVRKIAEPS